MGERAVRRGYKGEDLQNERERASVRQRERGQEGEDKGGRSVVPKTTQVQFLL